MRLRFFIPFLLLCMISLSANSLSLFGDDKESGFSGIWVDSKSSEIIEIVKNEKSFIFYDAKSEKKLPASLNPDNTLKVYDYGTLSYVKTTDSLIGAGRELKRAKTPPKLTSQAWMENAIKTRQSSNTIYAGNIYLNEKADINSVEWNNIAQQWFIGKNQFDKLKKLQASGYFTNENPKNFGVFVPTVFAQPTEKFWREMKDRLVDDTGAKKTSFGEAGSKRYILNDPVEFADFNATEKGNGLDKVVLLKYRIIDHKQRSLYLDAISGGVKLKKSSVFTVAKYEYQNDFWRSQQWVISTDKSIDELEKSDEVKKLKVKYGFE
jgi:hypothetical protein